MSGSLVFAQRHARVASVLLAAVTLPLVSAVLSGAGEVRFRHKVVDEENPRDPHCKAAADLDGDGQADLLAAGASNGGVYWYRAPGWTKHRIADGSFTTDMAAGDVDGSGNSDVIVPRREALVWFENPRTQGEDPAGQWREFAIDPRGGNMHDVEVADLDGDGRLDIVGRHQSGFGRRAGNRIHLWLQENPNSWSHRSFGCPHGEGLAVADLTRDGRADVVIGGRWYANPGTDVPESEWKEHLYVEATEFDKNWTNGDTKVAVGDLNGDGHPDIVLSPAEGQGRLAWFASPADPRRSPWREHVLAETDHVHALAVGDLNRDGQLDIVAAKMHQATPPREISIFLNQGNGRSWQKQVLATTGSHNIVLVDVGGDGTLDVYGANWNNNSPTGGALELWINEARPDGKDRNPMPLRCILAPILFAFFSAGLVLPPTAAPAQKPETTEPLAKTFSWKMGPALVLPRDVAGISCYSIKDPSIVRYAGRWHVFCTIRGKERSHGIVYLSFEDWPDANRAERHLLRMHEGFFCAPQVFYFSPHRRWYLICQAASDEWEPNYQPAFSTAEDLADPDGWSPLRPLFSAKPANVRAWLDFWIICDDAKAHLFFTSLDGRMWRSDTTLDAFPHGWSQPVVALEADIFEASHTYRLKGRDQFLTIIEAQGGHGWRYYKAYLADRLDGPWTPLAATKDRAFASMRNVEHPADRWTDSISHGELLRDGYDERLEVDPDRLRFVFQGVRDPERQGKAYGEIPWRLGLLEDARQD